LSPTFTAGGGLPQIVGALLVEFAPELSKQAVIATIVVHSIIKPKYLFKQHTIPFVLVSSTGESPMFEFSQRTYPQIFSKFRAINQNAV
jgi:hypothetical protein